MKFALDEAAVLCNGNSRQGAGTMHEAIANGGAKRRGSARSTAKVRRACRFANSSLDSQSFGLEQLESRVLLANIFWNVDADGFWDVASNWKDENGVSRLPGAGDDVFLDRAAEPFTITHRQGSDNVHSLHANTANLSLSGGSLGYA